MLNSGDCVCVPLDARTLGLGSITEEAEEAAGFAV
jgi:hypothetical protein